jgi:isopenicillin-N epimerase
LSVPAAIEFQEKLGLDAVRGRIAELAAYTRRVIGDTGLALATPDAGDLHGAMTAFRLPTGTDTAALRRDLWERHRIEAPVIERPEGLLIRVSTHFYQEPREIDALAHALRQLLRQ